MSHMWLHLACLAAVCITGLFAVDKACENVQMDMYVVADISLSIKPKALDMLRGVIRKVIETLNIGPENTRFGLITFAKGAEVALDINNGKSKADLLAEELITRNMEGFESGTETNFGLDLMMEKFKEAKDARPEAVQVGIVMTDGKATTKYETMASAHKVHDTTSITVVCVGIGDKIQQSELQLIASGKGNKNVYNARSFKDLGKLAPVFTKQACAAAAPVAFGTQAVAEEAPCPALCVKNGMMIGERHAGHTVKLVCDPGFTLAGPSEATCHADGLWSESSVPTCSIVKDCAYRGGLAKGDVKRSDQHTEPGGSVTYRCGPKHLLDGAQTTTCLEGGVWSDLPPTCVSGRCGTIMGITNGKIMKMKPVKGGKATFKCDGGYKLVGPAKLTCNSERLWVDATGQEAEAPTCVPKQCLPLLTKFRNGGVTRDSGKYIFTCNPGYSLQGESEITCDNEQWSAPIPTCESIACKWIPLLRNGYYTYASDMSEMTSHCNVGWKLEDGEATRKCENSEWVGDAPRCAENMCSGFKEIKNGYLDTPFQRTISSVIKFKCNEGYFLKGEAELTCQADAQWSSNPPRCRPIRNAIKEVKCPYVVSLSGFGSCTGERSPGDTVDCSCDPGYQRVGSAILACREDGSWDAAIPKCEWASCPFLGAITGGRTEGQSMLPGATVSYSCQDGFSLVGSKQVTCLLGGTWSAAEPKCEHTRCPFIFKIKNGYVSAGSDTDGSVRMFSCREGYALDGPAEIMCQNSEWGPVIPRCVKNKCKPFQYIHNGIVSGNNYEVGSKVTVTCDKDYRLEPAGGADIACQPNRKWAKDAKCVYNRCKAISGFRYGILKNYNDRVGSEVTIVCSRGYKLRGTQSKRSVKLTCQADLSWSDEIPVCERRILCPSICPGKRQADAHYSAKSPGSPVQFTCPEGTSMHGETTATCTEAGEWSAQPPVCVSEVIEECSGLRMDIVMVIDESKSISHGDFGKTREFVRKMIDSYDVGPKAAKVGIVKYSMAAKVVQTIDEFDTKAKMMGNPDGFLPRSEETLGTRTDRAIHLAAGLFKDPSVPRIIILVSDGKSNKEEKTILQATKAKEKKGIQIYTVGVGKGVDADEMRAVASSEDKFTFIENIDDAMQKTKSIITQTCTQVPVAAPAYFNTKSVIPPPAVLDPHTVTVAPECVGKQMDAYMVVDTSKSLKARELSQEQNVVASLLNSFDVGPNKTRVGVVTFNGDASHDFGLGDYTSRETLMTNAPIVVRPDNFKSGTATGAGLLVMLKSMREESKGQQKRVCYLITDGKSTDPEVVKEAIVQLKKTDIKVYVVVVGQAEKFNKQELIDISTHGSYTHLTGFSKIGQDDVKKIAVQAC